MAGVPLDGTALLVDDAGVLSEERCFVRESGPPAKPRLLEVPRLMAMLLYGSGLRLLECARLRVKDVDFASNQILVRAGKGDKDRTTNVPAVAKAGLARQLDRVKEQHRRDLLVPEQA